MHSWVLERWTSRDRRVTRAVNWLVWGTEPSCICRVNLSLLFYARKGIAHISPARRKNCVWRATIVSWHNKNRGKRGTSLRSTCASIRLHINGSDSPPVVWRATRVPKSGREPALPESPNQPTLPDTPQIYFPG